MKSSDFAYVAFVGVFSFLMIFIADRGRKAGVERIAEYQIPHSALEDPSLKQMSTHGPYIEPSVSGERSPDTGNVETRVLDVQATHVIR